MLSNNILTFIEDTAIALLPELMIIIIIIMLNLPSRFLSDKAVIHESTSVYIT